jgi:hypothetical protein
MHTMLYTGAVLLLSMGLAFAQKQELTPQKHVFPAPEHVSCDTLVGTTLLVSFDPVEGAAGYQIEWSALPVDGGDPLRESVFVSEKIPMISVEGVRVMTLMVRALDAPIHEGNPLQSGKKGAWSQPCNVPLL